MGRLSAAGNFPPLPPVVPMEYNRCAIGGGTWGCRLRREVRVGGVLGLGLKLNPIVSGSRFLLSTSSIVSPRPEGPRNGRDWLMFAQWRKKVTAWYGRENFAFLFYHKLAMEYEFFSFKITVPGCFVLLLGCHVAVEGSLWSGNFFASWWTLNFLLLLNYSWEELVG